MRPSGIKFCTERAAVVDLVDDQIKEQFPGQRRILSRDGYDKRVAGGAQGLPAEARAYGDNIFLVQSSLVKGRAGNKTHIKEDPR